MIRAELLIQGRVQGVFFRGSAQAEAGRLGLFGTVRNLPDGAVEAIVEGATDQVDAFIAWCRRGPPSAEVSGVEVRRSAPQGVFDTFTVST